MEIQMRALCVRRLSGAEMAVIVGGRNRFVCFMLQEASQSNCRPQLQAALVSCA